MDHITLGILAHVDAGKTTLSEALLYNTGAIRNAGRVDHGDAFLDTNDMEKERGITVFTKQALFSIGTKQVTLIDTPGHADFSAEMERALQALDYAILCISAAEGVESHTRTLWKLLEQYRIPTFIFVNKMDQPGADKAAVLNELKKELDFACVDFSMPEERAWEEDAAGCTEELLAKYITNDMLSDDEVRRAVFNRELFPCSFGAALRNQGIKEFLITLEMLLQPVPRSRDFGARVFKITHDEQGIRLTHMKITGGQLSVRDVLKGTDRFGGPWEEKVSQIRIYNGARYTTAETAGAGMVCAAAGLASSFQGEGIGVARDGKPPIQRPVLTYKLILPDGCDPALLYRQLKLIEDEEPMLSLVWREAGKEIIVSVMGEVQTEILKRQIKDRFGIDISFGEGAVLYKETIADTVEGVGHFEPLKHYAEVHLLLEPGEPGSGVVYSSDCTEDMLAGSWQRLIISGLKSKEHRGVLTGSPLTDTRITLIGGRAHEKHTEGGDFREAAFRAVRQGLMQAHSVLLEPYYKYCLVVPSTCVGRAMNDLRMMCAVNSELKQNSDTAVLTGIAPVSEIQNYGREVKAYSGGTGRLSFDIEGFKPCVSADAAISAAQYSADNDTDNPSWSVFCDHGAGHIVAWDHVKEEMHLPAFYIPSSAENENDTVSERADKRRSVLQEEWLDPDEVDNILARASYANSRNGGSKRKKWQYSHTSTQIAAADTEAVTLKPRVSQMEEYMLVDGYNVIFAWEGLKELADVNIDSARGSLIDILCNYQGMKQCRLIVVFDAYRIKGHPVESFAYHSIEVVYTKEAQTADAFIEQFAHENKGKYRITVVTSDGLEQIIIRSQGCALLSSREFEAEVLAENERMREMLAEISKSGRC